MNAAVKIMMVLSAIYHFNLLWARSPWSSSGCKLRGDSTVLEERGQEVLFVQLNQVESFEISVSHANKTPPPT